MRSKVGILMVGSSTKVKGGMTTVVQSFLQHHFSAPIKLTYIATHSERGKLYNSLFFTKSLIRIFFHLIIKRPIIVHVHMSERGSFVRKYIIFRMAKTLRKKVFVHTHGAEFKEYYLSASPVIQKMITGMLKNADKIIALGESWEKTLLQIEPKASTAVLMNSVPIPVNSGRAPDQTFFSILFLAVLIQRKGILDLIAASAQVIQEAKKQRRQVIFHIAGDGELMKRAKKLVADYGLSDSYRFYGWIGEQQKKELLFNADLFVLPSYNEGLPMSILEALSYGIPIISTKVGSINEAVIEGENGYLIKAGDIQALASRMLDIMNSPSSNEMRIASRKLAEDKFSDKQYFEQVEEMYMNSL